MADSRFDVLRLTALEAGKLLDEKRTTSVELVEAYLAQINAHNHSGLKLNALISVAPADLLLATARKLDHERSSGRRRSSLHGIPFVCKDVFVTHPSLGLPTTAGAPCFQTAVAKRTSPVIEHLLGMGMILIGKANMTEFCGLKTPDHTAGWSPTGGQTQSPFVFGGLEEDEKAIGHSSPGGSSSGSASAVASGFVPLSIGTEVCNSIVTPASRASLYALECSNGAINGEGCFGFSKHLDCIGGMAKSVEDLAVLTSVLMKRESPFDLGTRRCDGFRVAFTELEGWIWPESACSWPGETLVEIESGYAEAASTLKCLGSQVTENVDLPPPWAEFEMDDKSIFTELSLFEFANERLPAFINEFDTCAVRSLTDIVAYNEQNKDVCMPQGHEGQTDLTNLVDAPRDGTNQKAMLAEMRRRGRLALDTVLEDHDVIVSIADGPLPMYAAAAGYPIACVPLGVVKYSDENQRPYGLSLTAGKGQEGKLLQFMAAFESAFPSRPLPRPLLQWRDTYD
ncbi:amidase signature enzyme [Hortaea werneckii]|nr:amidase signature enzyme [Hortaea werneckii]KAI6959684.1 amidase signature enzyme [Hortaea werneckii]KAI7197941.1 amidase signature enzyme [Hortaea werneckii]KAI7589412.1 amidase signature enzyme [Hortaea werneckii]KAI7651664.1 amidase signature enzyme [Hortaea werneckii]